MFTAIRKWFTKRSVPVFDGFCAPPVLAGIPVTTETALQCPAVACAVTTLSNDLSSIPIFAYQRIGDGKERADNHPVYALLHDRPNNLLVTPATLKKTFWQAVFTDGNGYILISRNGAGRPVELVNLAPERVQVKVQGGTYFYLLDGKEAVVPADMLHVRFHSTDGIQGVGPIRLGRQVIGLALALDRYGAAFFGNGARPSGIIKYAGALSDQARENLRKSWSTEHQGTGNSAKTAVLEQGAEYVPISTPNEEAQFNETKQAVNLQIAQLWNVPPHKLKDLGRATWNNISAESPFLRAGQLAPVDRSA